MDDLENCKDQEVGEEFFNRGKKEKKHTPFKKILSFGKGKKKRTSSSSDHTPPVTPRARQPEVRNNEGRAFVEDFKHSPHFSVERTSSSSSHLTRSSSPLTRSSSPLTHRTRGNSGASSHSSSCARHSTHSSIHSETHDTPRFPASNHSTSAGSSRHSASIQSGDYSGSEGLDLPEPELSALGSFENCDIKSEHNSNSSIIYPGEMPDNDIASDVSRKSSKGFYDDLGISINFDEIPVAKEPVVDIENEIIIDLDGDVIKDKKELKVVREKIKPVILDNNKNVKDGLIFGEIQLQKIEKVSSPPVSSPTAEEKRSDRIVDSNLTAKIDSEMRINNECSRMMEELEKCTSSPCPTPTAVKKEVQSDGFKSPTPSVTVKAAPSPTFSEIDALLGNITADLDNLSF